MFAKTVGVLLCRLLQRSSQYPWAGSESQQNIGAIWHLEMGLGGSSATLSDSEKFRTRSEGTLKT